MKLFHGFPLSEWIGRQVKLDDRDAPGDARKPATIKAFNPSQGTALVLPGGHRRTEYVPLDNILPWWSRNDDLRRRMDSDADDDVLFHGLPISRFVGRTVILRKPRNKVKHAVLSSVKEGRAVVKPLSHDDEWSVRLEDLLPDWKNNKDLHQESLSQ